MFTKKLRRKFIIINMTRIDNDYELKSIMAHELGHAILHSNDSDFYVHEYTFFSRRKFEIEANRFASELLIDINNSNKDILKYYSLSQLSCYFKVPVELVKLKFNIY
nr:MAG TPA: IrrE protein [Caudoviricetes sp.]